MARETRLCANRYGAKDSPQRRRSPRDGPQFVHEAGLGVPSPCPPGLRSRKSSKRSQSAKEFQVGSAKCQVNCETNPIVRIEGPLDGHTVRGDPSRQTKPIAGPGGGFHADTPNTDRSCETNPIPSGPRAPSVPARSWTACRAKRSQFRDEGGLSPVLQRCCERIISRAAVRDKAGRPRAEESFRADTVRDRPPCGTKQSPGERDLSTPTQPSVRNEANSPGPAKACFGRF